MNKRKSAKLLVDVQGPHRYYARLSKHGFSYSLTVVIMSECSAAW